MERTDEDGPGYPGLCASCAREERRTRTAQTQCATEKVKCPTCGKRVKAVGLADHQRDAHGVVRVLTQEVPK
jgi:hypothetical protein